MNVKQNVSNKLSINLTHKNTFRNIKEKSIKLKDSIIE